MDFNTIKYAVLFVAILCVGAYVLAAGIVYWYIWIPIAAAIIGGIIYRKHRKRAQDMV